MTLELVTTFRGAYATDRGRSEVRFEAPTEGDALKERMRLRREGKRTPEEDQLLRATDGSERFTHDRRLAVDGVRWAPKPELRPVSLPDPWADPLWRPTLLDDAEHALAQAWDPSVHVDEAVRSLSDLDEVLNLLAERLESWTTRGGPEGRPEEEPTLEFQQSRERLEALRDSTASVRAQLEATVESTTPALAPNLSALLGPLLAARLISKAGGLFRLSRLPASTIQVLGAERAFFEHLRGCAPPPRHGVLFIHPEVQGAPRNVRGRIARALAGKAAIAARLDYARRPVDPRLAGAFHERARQVKATRPRRRT